MTTYFAAPAAIAKSKADTKEWAVAAHYNITRTKHDSDSCVSNADVVAGDKRISVKSARFSLLSASLCAGLTDFDAIWNRFESIDNANVYAYVTEDFNVFEMNAAEFKTFVYKFCGLDRESAKNGGGVKIRCRSESKALLKWLNNRV